MRAMIRMAVLSALALALIAPGTVLAAPGIVYVHGNAVSCIGSCDPASGQAAAVDPPNAGCKDGKCKQKEHRVRGANAENSAFRIYSMMTGRSVDDIQKACADMGVSIWKLAGQEGRLQALKDKLIAGHALGLDSMVKSGVLSEQQRDEFINRLKQKLDEVSK